MVRSAKTVVKCSPKEIEGSAANIFYGCRSLVSESRFMDLNPDHERTKKFGIQADPDRIPNSGSYYTWNASFGSKKMVVRCYFPHNLPGFRESTGADAAS